MLLDIPLARRSSDDAEEPRDTLYHLEMLLRTHENAIECIRSFHSLRIFLVFLFQPRIVLIKL